MMIVVGGQHRLRLDHLMSCALFFTSGRGLKPVSSSLPDSYPYIVSATTTSPMATSLTPPARPTNSATLGRKFAMALSAIAGACIACSALGDSDIPAFDAP
jgi:hypothetical protein